MMRCQIDHVTTRTVAPATEVRAELPATGVLRFARKGAAMAGTPALAIEDGALALHYADGASIYVENI